MPSVSEALPRGKTELRPSFRIETGDYVSALRVARQGSICVVGLGDGRVVGFELSSGKEIFSVEAHAGGVLGIAASPDGAYFASSGQDATAKIWSSDGSLVR